jgi:hypothetical protein
MRTMTSPVLSFSLAGAANDHQFHRENGRKNTDLEHPTIFWPAGAVQPPPPGADTVDPRHPGHQPVPTERICHPRRTLRICHRLP